MSTLPLNRPTLADLRNVGEFANNFRWNMSIPQPPAFWQDNGIDTLSGGGYLINCLCESTGLPKKTVGKIPIIMRGHQFFQPGIVTPESVLKLNFIENVTGVIHTFFQTWQEAIWATNIGQGERYENLVADTVRLIRLDNADKPICMYDLKYCFLQSYTLPNVSGQENNVFRVGVTLSYDDFYIASPETIVNNVDLAGADILPNVFASI